MLGYIKGKILQAENGVVLLENGGVGYEIVCSASVYAKLLNEGEGEVYTYLAVREDDISLYGFVSPEEKKMFLKLTSVSGVGPKMGIGILSAMNLGQLAVAIATADVRTLSSVKGLGKKTAERIVLELREKVNAEDVPEGDAAPAAGKEADEDAVVALMTLGFTRAESVQAVSAAMAAGAMGIQQIIAYALKGMR